ncbi:hypothetical protein [uncultured Helicobacter sp.]
MSSLALSPDIEPSSCNNMTESTLGGGGNILEVIGVKMPYCF